MQIENKTFKSRTFQVHHLRQHIRKTTLKMCSYIVTLTTLKFHRLEHYLSIPREAGWGIVTYGIVKPYLFTMAAANAACRQLGYTGAVNYGRNMTTYVMVICNCLFKFIFVQKSTSAVNLVWRKQLLKPVVFVLLVLF